MDSTKIVELKTRFTGEVVLPSDVSYAQLKNTPFTKGAPALIVQPKTPQDIATAIAFAKECSLVLSIRSGGHSGAGFSTNTGGMVIDLSSFTGVEVIDASKQVVRIGAGAKWIDVAMELHKHGLALSSGDTKTVGVGGLTLGGGMGWMVRKYGLAIDNLVAAEVVLADGSVVRASATEKSDLFWALRGGGGNFGVVTYFEFTVQNIGKVYSGTITFKRDDIAGTLKGWRDYMRTADESVTTIVNVLPSFAGNDPGIFLTVCCVMEDLEKAKSLVEPLKKIGVVVKEDLKEKEYYEVLEEAHPTGDMKIVVRDTFIPEFTDEVVAGILAAVEKKPDIILQIRGFGGAMNRVAADATAFGYRNTEVMLLSPTFLPPNVTAEQEKEAMTAWNMLEKFGTGAYANFFSTSSPHDVEIIYPKTTLERLRTIKQKYDPQNVFNQNYNIVP